jgi:hypothetical protein
MFGKALVSRLDVGTHRTLKFSQKRTLSGVEGCIEGNPEQKLNSFKGRKHRTTVASAVPGETTDAKPTNRKRSIHVP